MWVPVGVARHPHGHLLPTGKVYPDGFDRKKIMVVEDMVETPGTFQHGGPSRQGGGIAQEKNLMTLYWDGQSHPCRYFFSWVRDKVAKGSRHSPANGILYSKREEIIQRS